MAESTMSMMSAILCGTNFVLHSAGWLEGGLAMGYEKFVMDADFCGALHRWLEGVSLDDDEFALDGFLELGPGKHFFSAQHTLRHYETAFYDSPTADNNSFEQWRDAGESRTEERAAAIVAKTLAEYEPPPLDDSIDEALCDFIAEKKSSMPDMWY
jgi:trimethylamine--corrinoid protein Co-methyltransferase